MSDPRDRLAASHSLWERARRVMPGGVYGHQNGAAHGDLHPRFLVRGEGSRVWDVDGNEYVDWMCDPPVWITVPVRVPALSGFSARSEDCDCFHLDQQLRGG